jgi:hypothetical protein
MVRMNLFILTETEVKSICPKSSVTLVHFLLILIAVVFGGGGKSKQFEFEGSGKGQTG